MTDWPKADWQTDNGRVRLYRADCLAVLPLLPAGVVAAIVTDPPYGIGFQYDAHDDTPAGYGDWLWSVMMECERICAPGSPLFVWQGMPNCREWPTWFPRDYRIFAAAKNFVQIRPHAMQNAFDPVLVWWTDGARYRHPGGITTRDFHLADTASIIGNPRRLEKGHPCPRPLDTVRYIAERFVRPGGPIADPFMGSGTAAVACLQTGHPFIGIEVSPAYFDIAVLRIESALKEPDLYREVATAKPPPSLFS